MSNDRRKYFFDLNNFDAPSKADLEKDLPPPPPVFSLDELGAAKGESFSQGRQQGLEEARASREQYIAAQISAINEQLRALFLSEQIREKKFEEDVLTLCQSIFLRIFPSLSARHSIDELLDVIHKVLANQESARIIVEVPQPDYDDIAQRLALLIESENGRIHLTGVSHLGSGSCRMRWEHGGALRDQQSLVKEVMDRLEDVLAPSLQKSQNSESEATSTTDPEGER